MNISPTPVSRLLYTRPVASRRLPAGDSVRPVQWFVYLLRCADGSVYAGITTDVKRRVLEHNTDDELGARYTRGRRPVELVYVECVGSRADAAKREHALKSMRRAAKLALIERAIL